MRFILAGLLLSFNSFASVQWKELKAGNTYTMVQGFKLPTYDGSSEFITFLAGEKVVLKEILPLDLAFPVTAYLFHYENCPSQTTTTALEIIPVQGTSPVVEIGAQLDAGCELSIYNEDKDLHSLSIFE